jgi:hypothetical protein
MLSNLKCWEGKSRSHLNFEYNIPLWICLDYYVQQLSLEDFSVPVSECLQLLAVEGQDQECL